MSYQSAQEDDEVTETFVRDSTGIFKRYSPDHLARFFPEEPCINANPIDPTTLAPPKFVPSESKLEAVVKTTRAYVYTSAAAAIIVVFGFLLFI